VSDLTQKKCVACEGGVPPATPEQVKILLKEVPGWTLRQAQDDPSASSGQAEHLQIEREFKFKDFKQAMGFVNKVADIAEAEGHHPNIHIKYSEVWLELYTHAINGLHENDFIVAAKINELDLT
jgi:4a-hydroxytetrahydrobiopterin dehydratase